MQLIAFRKNASECPEGKERGGAADLFGIVVDGCAVSFDHLQKAAGIEHAGLRDPSTFFESYAESISVAHKLHDFATRNSELLASDQVLPMRDVRILPPIPTPPAILDFGLSPRHLYQSGLTLINKEFGFPVNTVLSRLLKRQVKKEKQAPKFRYYKSNHHAVIGDSDVMDWPRFTSYLDIEPELAIVTGTAPGSHEAIIAGYVIFNDGSARDVQLEDFLGMTGPTRSKDFARSKGLGPYIVTPDEIPDPTDLDVQVTVSDRYHWRGSTSEYVAHPQEVLDYVNTIFTPKPGTIIGMGTIPDCCSLETREWLRPGDVVEITFDKLGTLRQHIPAEIGPLQSSKWRQREELRPWYER